MPAPMQKRKLMGEINVVPYIDVMLVLLVIFMVTAPLLTQGVEVELPKAGAEPIDDVPNHPPLENASIWRLDIIATLRSVQMETKQSWFGMAEMPAGFFVLSG